MVCQALLQETCSCLPSSPLKTRAGIRIEQASEGRECIQWEHLGTSLCVLYIQLSPDCPSVHLFVSLLKYMVVYVSLSECWNVVVHVCQFIGVSVICGPVGLSGVSVCLAVHQQKSNK